MGYRYGTYAEMEISNNYTDWGVEEILDRGIKLTYFLQKRWNLKIGTKKEIMEFLGLDFLNEKAEDRSKNTEESENRL